MVFAPRRLLRIPKKVGPRDIMVVAVLATTQTAEIALRAIGAGTIEGVSLLVIDALHIEVLFQFVPTTGLVRMKYGAVTETRLDPAFGISL